jgi:hypothetical protein
MSFPTRRSHIGCTYVLVAAVLAALPAFAAFSWTTEPAMNPGAVDHAVSDHGAGGQGSGKPIAIPPSDGRATLTISPASLVHQRPECAPLLGPCLASSAYGWVAGTSLISPSPRYGPMMSFDSADGYVVLFGGFDGSTPPDHVLNDTWIFRSGEWSELFPAISPPPRAAGSFATDPVTGCLVLFGGAGYNSIPYFGDTWTFCHGQWHQVVASDHPSARAGAGLVTDPPCGCLVLFGGGNQNTSVLNTTWEYAGGVWSYLNLTVSPPGRSGMQIAFDYASNDVVLFSGSEYGTPSQNDTWIFSGSSWQHLLPAITPSPRERATFTSCPGIGAPILFGGYGSYPSTWSYSADDWTNVTGPTKPAAREFAGAACDAADSEIVLFGGLNNWDVPTPQNYTPWGTIYGDTWTYGGSRVTFAESGLPNGTQWAVDLNGTTINSTVSSLSLVLGHGHYPYSVLPTPFGNSTAVRYGASVPSGWLNISGATSTQVSVSFESQGLVVMDVFPTGAGVVSPNTTWAVLGSTLDLEAFPSAGWWFAAWSGIGNGSYSGWQSPAALQVRNPVNETAEFIRSQPYPIGFVESGLPSGWGWSVSIDGREFASNLSTIISSLPNGTYTWLVQPPTAPGVGLRFVPSNSSGVLTVFGQPTTIFDSFREQAAVNVSTSPTGDGEASPTSGWYDLNSSIILVAMPSTGFAFSDWIGTGRGAYTGVSIAALVQVRGPIGEAAQFVHDGRTSGWLGQGYVPYAILTAIVVLVALVGFLVWLRRPMGKRPMATDPQVHGVA